jgi:hypothetical protein
MKAENNNESTTEVDDFAPIQVSDHLMIRDVDSGKVLVNIKNTARNLSPKDSDGNNRQ